jgi:hypothetical protein
LHEGDDAQDRDDAGDGATPSRDATVAQVAKAAATTKWMMGKR